MYLAARLAHGGFRLLDTQFVTDHLRQFGTVELNREEFHRLLEKSLDVDADFKRLAPDASPEMILAILEFRRLPPARVVRAPPVSWVTAAGTCTRYQSSRQRPNLERDLCQRRRAAMGAAVFNTLEDGAMHMHLRTALLAAAVLLAVLGGSVAAQADSSSAPPSPPR